MTAKMLPLSNNQNTTVDGWSNANKNDDQSLAIERVYTECSHDQNSISPHMSFGGIPALYHAQTLLLTYALITAFLGRNWQFFQRKGREPFRSSCIAHAGPLDLCGGIRKLIQHVLKGNVSVTTFICQGSLKNRYPHNDYYSDIPMKRINPEGPSNPRFS